MRKLCPHKVLLPKGLRCNHGYLEILLTVNRRRYCRTFGQHTRDAQKIAEIHLAEKRREILLGAFDMAPAIEQKKFVDVADIWLKEWRKETEPDGKIAHSEESVYETERTVERIFKPLFAKFLYDEIKPVDIERWRDRGIANGLSGTTLNRYQATLSTIFSRVDRWIKTERIKPAFKIPPYNPCTPVKKAPNVVRDRILTVYEAKKLKLAFAQLNDTDGWEICKLALKSVLSMKDLKGLELGKEIDIKRAKTGVAVNIPLPILVTLNWKDWRRRWDAARIKAGFGAQAPGAEHRAARAVGTTIQFRDLRKTGINWLKGRHDLKLISEYAGHADIKTTERSYTINQAEYLEPLATDLDSQVEAI